MKLHELKIKQEYLEQVDLGKKTFELRKNDRDYQVGDLIKFICIKDEPSKDELCHSIDFGALYQITYVLKDCPQYGLNNDYCILAIKKLRVLEQ